MTQLSQRLGLDLADAFACNRERLSNFFERRVSAYQVAVEGEVSFDVAF